MVFDVPLKTCEQRILQRQAEFSATDIKTIKPINNATTRDKVHCFNNPLQALQTYEEHLLNNKPTPSEKFSELWTVNKDGQIINKDKKILIATTNAGKIDIYTSICENLQLYSTNLKELVIEKESIENGKNELENAIIKAKFYNKITGLPVNANDSGLIIDNLSMNDQPGILIRRYGEKDNSDKELLDVYINKLNEIGGSSSGHYNVALALIDKNDNLFTKLYKLKPIFYFHTK